MEEERGSSFGCKLARRSMLGACLGMVPWLAHADETSGPAASPPQVGDRLVFLTGEKKGQVVRVDDLPLGGPQVQAYPQDPKTGVVRDGSRLNLIILARFAPEDLSEETRARSAHGVVAYSGVCTHQGCPVNMWSNELHVLFCSCHGSMYDPKNGAQVVGGPAPRPLPSLPLKANSDIPVVAAGFTARVGPERY
ncbi:MAG: Rieske (2Fe-2S) protein [Acidobacteriia bacterium]|nr:Rieske (2Fe-2S) protein [Methyloceanibacter sp.]MCL6491602.1 Rieske (2Fe-2S) protein [Terriglobia bacterium]